VQNAESLQCVQATSSTELAIQQPQVHVDIHSNRPVFTRGKPCFLPTNFSTTRREKRFIATLIISAVISTAAALAVKAAVDLEFHSYTELMNTRMTDLIERVNEQMTDIENQMLKLRDNQQELYNKVQQLAEYTAQLENQQRNWQRISLDIQ